MSTSAATDGVPAAFRAKSMYVPGGARLALAGAMAVRFVPEPVTRQLHPALAAVERVGDGAGPDECDLRDIGAHLGG